MTLAAAAAAAVYVVHHEAAIPLTAQNQSSSLTARAHTEQQYNQTPTSTTAILACHRYTTPPTSPGPTGGLRRNVITRNRPETSTGVQDILCAAPAACRTI